MLDAVVGMIVITLVLHMLLTIVLVIQQNKIETKQCDHFYLSIQLERLRGADKWNVETPFQISVNEIIVEITENRDVVKRSKQGGYEYLGTCAHIHFNKVEEEAFIVFDDDEKKETEEYPLNKS